MLQQTQVKTVLPYYDRFLKTFPDVFKLAEAEEATLMQHWEGLGYYRRARSMHAAAKRIVEDHDGVFPSDFDEVLALPGIGRYTAGAILSISGDQRFPVLEGNTQRVFSRWVALRRPPTETQSTKLLWQIAESMLPPKKGSGLFNQAAMELGALVCTPKNPNCGECPVRKHCAAHRFGKEAEIPGKLAKIKYESRREYAFVVREAGAGDDEPPRYLMRALPEGVRWSGLWDFPRTIERSIDSVEEAAVEVSVSLNQPLQIGEPLTRIKHAVTKYRIELQVHHADLPSPSASQNHDSESPWKFVTAKEMKKLPLSVTGRKIAKLLD
ncbi:A/G-specific adenine glycosylase [Rubripirellula obstinata]|uniref:Adenine DNA glycosylase n=2 Tax=Rubripirellula obstinata TaxID=406547 RepID=A0A5B1CLR8_9BACT|nr:A/G-specific adenine glycosylase [Rubripirellula obstinata]